MPDAGAVRSKRGCHSFGQLVLRRRDPFAHLLACKVEVGSLLKDHEDEAHSVHRLSPDTFYVWQTLKSRCQRIGHLILYDLRRASHPLGEDDHLVLGEVGDGIDW